MGIPWRPEAEKKLPLYGMTVMVNPGHNVIKDNGSFDAGAKGRLGKTVIKEMDLNAKVAQNVKRKFEILGANVIFVEKTKIKDIQALENKIHPDLFIAIHHDAKGPGKSPNGGETVFCWGNSEKSGEFINNEFKKDKTIKNNKPNSKWASELCVLRADSTINAVLVEVGFMTNKNELKMLNSTEYQDKAAQMIVDGSRNFLRTTKAQKEKESAIKEDEKFKKSILFFDPNKKPDYKLPAGLKDFGRDI